MKALLKLLTVLVVFWVLDLPNASADIGDNGMPSCDQMAALPQVEVEGKSLKLKSLQNVDYGRLESYLLSTKLSKIKALPNLFVKVFGRNAEKLQATTTCGFKVVVIPIENYTVENYYGYMSDTAYPQNSAAHYRVNRLLGFDLVSPTVMREITHKGKKQRVAVQYWLSGGKKYRNSFQWGRDAGNKDLSGSLFMYYLRREKSPRIREQFHHLGLLDHLTGTHDRNPTNIVVLQGENVLSVDSGYGFYGNYRVIPIDPPELREMELHFAWKDKLCNLMRNAQVELSDLLEPSQVSQLIENSEAVLAAIKESEEVNSGVFSRSNE